MSSKQIFIGSTSIGNNLPCKAKAQKNLFILFTFSFF